MDIRQVVAFAKEGRYIGPEGITALASEVERLHKWADSFSDAQLEERATGERYQQELRAEIKKLTSQVETLTADNERLRKVEQVAWIRTESYEAVQAVSDAHARGMRDAAEIARGEQVDAEATGCPTDVAYNHACDDIADAILSAIPNHKQGGEVCEWVLDTHDERGEFWEPGCVASFRGDERPPEYFNGPVRFYRFERCPYCGKPINIKEG